MNRINVPIGMRPISSVAHTPAFGAARGKSAHFARAAVPFVGDRT